MTSPFIDSFSCPTQDLRVVTTGNAGAMVWEFQVEEFFFFDTNFFYQDEYVFFNSLRNLINILYEFRCQGVYFFIWSLLQNAFLQFDSLFSSKQLDSERRLKPGLGITGLVVR